MGSNVAESSDPESGEERSLWRGIVMLAFASAIAGCVATTIFAFVFYADFLNGAAGAVAGMVLRHDALAVAVATSPIFAFLLVGYGYMQKGMRRRAVENVAAAAAAADGTGPATSPDDGRA